MLDKSPNTDVSRRRRECGNLPPWANVLLVTPTPPEHGAIFSCDLEPKILERGEKCSMPVWPSADKHWTQNGGWEVQVRNVSVWGPELLSVTVQSPMHGCYSHDKNNVKQ